jgi:hypothetical protein
MHKENMLKVYMKKAHKNTVWSEKVSNKHRVW